MKQLIRTFRAGVLLLAVPLVASLFMQAQAQTSLTVQPQAQLNGSTAPGGQFAASVAIDGDTAVVGAPLDGQAGSAYVYARSGTSWTLVQRLSPADGQSGDNFGFSVAIKGDTIIVGAPLRDTLGVNSGGAYAFSRTPAGWQQSQIMSAIRPAPGDQFGFSVSLSNSALIIGAPQDDDLGENAGTAYIWTRGTTAWENGPQIFGGDTTRDDQFGTSVSMSATTALVGAPQDDDAGNNSGSAYLFSLAADGGWPQAAKLVADDASAGDVFGYSVSLDGNWALIGAFFDDNPGATNSGAAYLFQRGGTGWSQNQKLVANNAAAEDRAGYAVALSGGLALVGAPFRDNNTAADVGALYIWARGAGGWTQQTPQFGVDARDFFARSVSLSGYTMLAGAPYDDPNGAQDAGTASLLIVPGTDGTLAFAPTPAVIGDPLTVTVNDADLNTDASAAESITVSVVSSDGESETLTLEETGVDTGSFSAAVTTELGSSAGANGDGAFVLGAGDSLTATYVDDHRANGGAAT
ncbi:MAG: hypothetical protein JNJ61_26350, partial [Anaerolineae bacterium]|nr:hypothetical protein [Anaerolineae bacterium]